MEGGIKRKNCAGSYRNEKNKRLRTKRDEWLVILFYYYKINNNIVFRTRANGDATLSTPKAVSSTERDDYVVVVVVPFCLRFVYKPADKAWFRGPIARRPRKVFTRV